MSKHTCELCKETFNYDDEVVHFNCNGEEVYPNELQAQNPDHIVAKVCAVCYAFNGPGVDELLQSKGCTGLGSER